MAHGTVRWRPEITSRRSTGLCRARLESGPGRRTTGCRERQAARRRTDAISLNRHRNRDMSRAGSRHSSGSIGGTEQNQRSTRCHALLMGSDAWRASRPSSTPAHSICLAPDCVLRNSRWRYQQELLAQACDFRHQLRPEVLRGVLIGALDLGGIVGQHPDMGGGERDPAGAQPPGQSAFAQRLHRGQSALRALDRLPRRERLCGYLRIRTGGRQIADRVDHGAVPVAVEQAGDVGHGGPDRHRIEIPDIHVRPRPRASAWNGRPRD